jgi:D-sedoheptulose 7-phosphate isomerase
MSTNSLSEPQGHNEARDYLFQTFDESLKAKKAFFESHSNALIQAAKWFGETVSKGSKILICGNGGSAADAQHLAAEMVGRMLLERRPLAALALTTDTSILTAVGNDYSYDEIFLKQVQGLGRAGDLLLAISTSGNSKNVILAVEEAKRMGLRTIGLTGGTGGKLLNLVDLSLVVREGKNSSRIQETHLFALHSMVDLCDRFFLTKS